VGEFGDFGGGDVAGDFDGNIRRMCGHFRLGVGSTSQEGYYTISIYTTPGAESGCAVDPCFRAVANPPAGSAQAVDTKRSIFSINHIGQKTAKAADNMTVTNGDCW
jgi:hypothetical protein